MINLIFPLTLVDILYVYTVGVINILGYSISPFWKTTLIIVDALLLLLVLFYILLTKYKNIPASSNELLKQIPIDLTEINPQFFDEIINKLNRKYKCYECKIYKPERTHHCSTCRQCYLKMDHHCVFLNCCIHFHNFKFFLIGLFFGLLYNLYNIMHIIILHNFNAYNTVAVVLCTINFILCTVLFSVNIMQALRNETTIERMTIDQVLRDNFNHIDNFQIGIIRQLNHHITDRATLNPYNINMKYNIQSVLGKSLKELFSFEIVGNGLEFEKNNKIF